VPQRQPTTRFGPRSGLAPVKSNLCAKPASLAFTHEPAEGTNRLAWLGEVAFGADEVLTNPAGPRNTVLDSCEAALADVLREGATESEELNARLAAMEYSERTVKRARQALVVKVRRVGFGAEGRCLVELPPDDGDGGLIPDRPAHRGPSRQGRTGLAPLRISGEKPIVGQAWRIAGRWPVLGQLEAAVMTKIAFAAEYRRRDNRGVCRLFAVRSTETACWDALLAASELWACDRPVRRNSAESAKLTTSL
jgi:hypothetical protein